MTAFVHVRHEMERLSRMGRSHAVRVAFVGCLIALAALIWPWGAGGRQQLLLGSADLFKLFFVTEMALAMLVVPALVAPAIPAEREAQTLELLVSCPEPEGRLVLGKLASNAALVLALLAAGFPVAFASTLLGGVPVGRAAVTCVHILMAAAFSCVLALRCSLAFRSAVAATLAALFLQVGVVGGLFLVGNFVGGFLTLAMPLLVFYAVIGLFAVAMRGAFLRRFPLGCLGAFGVGALLLGLAAFDAPAIRGWGGAPEHVMAAICPWIAFFRDAMTGERQPWWTIAGAWSVQALLCAAVVPGILRLSDSERLLSGESLTPAKEKASADARFAAAKARQERARARCEAVGIEPVKRREPRDWFQGHPRAEDGAALQTNPFLPVGDDPVFWKETSWDRFPALDALRDFSTVVAWFSAFAGTLSAWSGAQSHPALTIELALLAILVGAAGASTIAPERASGTLAVLLSTAYPPARIIRGKALAVLAWCRPVLIPVGVHIAGLILRFGAPAAGVGVVFVLTVLSVLGVSMGVSGATKRPRVAFALGAILVGALWTVPGLCAERWPASRMIATNPFDAAEEMLALFSGSLRPLAQERLVTFTLVAGFLALFPPALAGLAMERQVRA